MKKLFAGALTFSAMVLPPLPTPQMDIDSYSIVLNKSEDQCGNRDCHLWHQFVRAESLKSCVLFTQLSKEHDFPLLPLILVKETALCPSETALNQIKDLLKNPYKPWLKEKLSMALVEGSLTLNTSDALTLVLATAPTLFHKKAKIELLQKALTSAQSKSAPELTQIQNELYKWAPRFIPVPEDWVSVANDAFYNHDYVLARKGYERALARQKLPLHVKRLVLENLKIADKATGSRDVALKTAKTLMLLNLKHLLTVDDLKQALISGVSYSRFLWTDGQDEQALQNLKFLEKKLGQKISLDELYFVRGRIFEEERKIPQALLWMGKAFHTASDPQSKTTLGWSWAWLNYKNNNLKDTQNALADLSKTETDPGRKAQESFWLAKTLFRLHHPDDARALLEQIIQDDPIGYYTILSYRELKMDLPKPTSLLKTDVVLKIPKRLPMNLDVDWTFFNWLVSVGEWPWAREFLEFEVPLPDGAPDQWEELFSRYAQAGYYAPIFSRFTKLTPEEKTQAFAKEGSILFPKQWVEFVDDGSHHSGLWPEYIFSIMRQESSFDSNAISPANAYGLMQLLPQVAQNLSGNKHLTGEDLLDPQTNIMLGSLLLRKYWDTFGGQFILTTAAYNASEDVVKGWVKSLYHGDPLVFIEDIPYEETRVYVKLVLRNLVNYMRLSTQAPVSFPEWCLEGVQASK